MWNWRHRRTRCASHDWIRLRRTRCHRVRRARCDLPRCRDFECGRKCARRQSSEFAPHARQGPRRPGKSGPVNSFEYASPNSVQDAISLLNPKWGATEILAGGTDLVALMKDFVIKPTRLINIKKIAGMSAVSFTPRTGLCIGALVTMDDLAKHPLVTKQYPTLAQAIGDAASPQIRNRATLGGNLCQRPRCWYFRNGYGLLGLDAKGQSLVLQGDNRYHAILGNAGPAYFVSPSTIAPVLVALGAVIEIAAFHGTRTIPLENFYRIPQKEGEREHDLAPNEILIRLKLPPPERGASTAYYEVRQKHGFDWP